MLQKVYSIFPMVDRFFKIALSCNKTRDSVKIASLFFEEIVQLHRVPGAIVSDCDVKFMGYFWQSLWKMMNTKLQDSSAYHSQTDGNIQVIN